MHGSFKLDLQKVEELRNLSVRAYRLETQARQAMLIVSCSTSSRVAKTSRGIH